MKDLYDIFENPSFYTDDQEEDNAFQIFGIHFYKDEELLKKPYGKGRGRKGLGIFTSQDYSVSSQKRNRENLTDHYVRITLGLNMKDKISQEIIELKRLQLKAIRLLRIKKGENNGKNDNQFTTGNIIGRNRKITKQQKQSF